MQGKIHMHCIVITISYILLLSGPFHRSNFIVSQLK